MKQNVSDFSKKPASTSRMAFQTIAVIFTPSRGSHLECFSVTDKPRQTVISGISCV